jgi:hypothetical protein
MMSTLIDSLEELGINDIENLIGSHSPFNLHSFLSELNDIFYDSNHANCPPSNPIPGNGDSPPDTAPLGDLATILANSHLDPDFTQPLLALKSIDFADLLTDSDSHPATSTTGSNTHSSFFEKLLQAIEKSGDSTGSSAINVGHDALTEIVTHISNFIQDLPHGSDLSDALELVISKIHSESENDTNEATHPIAQALDGVSAWFDSHNTPISDHAFSMENVAPHTLFSHDFIF